MLKLVLSQVVLFSFLHGWQTSFTKDAIEDKIMIQLGIIEIISETTGVNLSSNRLFE
jgi:hypothetical protein